MQVGGVLSGSRWALESAVVAVAVVVAIGSGCNGSSSSRSKKPVAPEAPQDGLVATITAVDIGEDRRPVVHFTLTDAEGRPVELTDLDGNPSFTIASIETDPATGLTRYQCYVTRTVTGANYVIDGVTFPPALASAVQPATDSGGSFASLGGGQHRYTFGTSLPGGYDRTATHTVAGYLTRGDDAWVANPWLHFVPDGGPVQVTRDIASTEACNSCHAPLEAHGGARRELALCVVCHTSQGTDPESGNSLEMNHMIHRIHRGHSLANLPYFIIGRNGSVHDYSHVGFPQDLRNCDTCHTNAADADRWKSSPSRTACGSCHDDVDFATGAGHSTGIPQDTDEACSTCHRADTGLEFDQSVAGAHVVPYESSLQPNLRLAITAVSGMTAGGQPVVSFTVENGSGPVDITTLDRVATAFGGPTTDYTQLISTSHLFTIRGGGATGTLVTNAVGDYTWTAPGTYALPVDAAGTWSVGLEARTVAVTAGSESVRFGANNPVAAIDVSTGVLAGGSPVARRDIVDETLCNRCHSDLLFHGNLRTEIEYCVICHNPNSTDETRRPGLDPVTNPPQTIDFKFMIHSIHRGHDLEGPYTVYGFGNTPHDFTEVLFPGDLRDCATCHLEETNTVQVLPGAAATVLNIAGVTVPQDDAVRPPTTAACTSCHDSTSARTHAAVNSIVDSETDWAESCETCHGEGSAFAVSEMHAR